MPTRTVSPSLTARLEQREARIRRFGYKNYADYIGSAKWREVRARYFNSALVKVCVLCGEEKVSLHHRTYERVCEERLSDLVPLCMTCHADVHALSRRGDIELGDVEKLRNAEQAKAYESEVTARAERFAGYDDQADHDYRRLLRQRRNRDTLLRLRTAQIRAERLKADISGPMRVIVNRIEQIERMLDKADGTMHRAERERDNAEATKRRLERIDLKRHQTPSA